MKKILSELVIRSNKFQLLRYINSLPYQFGLNFTPWYFRPMSEIRSIYLRRGMISRDWVPGNSDIDLSIITKKMGMKKELWFLKNFWNRYLKIKKVLPFLGEAGICNENELNNWYMFSGVRAREMGKWKLLYGDEIRKEKRISDLLMLRIEALWEALSVQYADSLSNMMFYQKSFKNAYLRPYFKFFVDILRYGSYSSHITKAEVCDREYFVSKSSRYIQHETGKVVDLFKEVKNLNYFSPKSEEIILTSFSKSLRFLDNVCGSLLNDLKKRKIFRKLKISKYNLEPKSKEVVMNSLKPFVDNIYDEIKELTESIILSSSGCRDRRYLLYIILKDDLNDEEIQDVFYKIKKELLLNIDSWPFEYFDFSKAPLLFTKNMFKCHLYLPWWSLEYFYLVKHGKTLKGHNLVKNLNRPSDYFILKGLLSYASFLPIHLKSELQDKQTFSKRLIDDICGDLPAILLALEKGIIPTTVSEAILEYNDNYEEFSQWLTSFYDTYSKIPIKELERNFNSVYAEAYPFIYHWLNKISFLFKNFQRMS